MAEVSALRDLEELRGYTQSNPLSVSPQEATDVLSQREESARVAGTVSPFQSSFNPFNPNFRATAQNAISNMLGGSNISSNPNYLQGRIANTLSGLVDFIPAVGDAVGVGDTITSYRQGDIPSTVINAAATGIGVLPLVGGPASKAVKAGGNRFRSALRGIAAGHASPHEFEKFSMNNIGTGEGAQVYGHGLYFGENPKVIDEYFDAFNEPVLRFKERNVDTPYTGELRDRFKDVYQGLINYDAARAWKENLLDVADSKGLNVDEVDDKLNVLFKNVFEGSETPRDFAAIDDYGLGIDLNEIYDLAGEQLVLDNVLGGISQAKTINDLQYVVEGFSPQEMRLYKDLVKPELAELSNSASRYDVNLNVEPEELLDWDRPLTEQPRALNAIKQLYLDDMKRIDANSLAGEPKLSELYTSVDDVSMSDLGLFDTSKGSQAYNTIASSNMGRGAEELSRKLKERGIKGIKYFDGMSRNTGEGTRNYVMFDDSLIDTKRVNDKLTDSWMNPEARMARAQDLGYDMDNVFYHGTNKTFEEFDASLGQGARKDTGVFVSNSPDVASSYAGGTSAQVLPLRVRLENPIKVYADGNNWSKLGPNTRVDLPRRVVNQSEDADLLEELGFDRGSNTRTEPMGTYTLGELFPDRFGGIKDAKLAELFGKDSYLPMTTNDVSRWARKQGADGVIFEDISDRGSRGAFDNDKASMPSRNAIIFDPKNIRSTNAEFDPTKADSADLLSSISPTQSSLRNIA